MTTPGRRTLRVTDEQREVFFEAGVFDERRPIPDDIPVRDLVNARHEADALRDTIS
jgi:hypothetical protein